MAARRSRTLSNSAAAAVSAALNAAKGLIEPPAYVKLTESARKYWPAVVCARARDDWSESDLIVAGQLAKCMADMADEDAKLDAEGKVIENGRGSPVMNPRTAVMEQLARREMALIRTLRLGGRVAGDPRDGLGRAKVERAARKVLQEVEQEDELLA